jgi:hypothetical protein
MSGGYISKRLGGMEASDKVIITNDGSIFDQVTSLPLGLYHHSLVIVNDTTLFVTGGQTHTVSLMSNH